MCVQNEVLKLLSLPLQDEFGLIRLRQDVEDPGYLNRYGISLPRNRIVSRKNQGHVRKWKPRFHSAESFKQ